jgi:DNA-binding XRE family transcriptional regulator
MKGIGWPEMGSKKWREVRRSTEHDPASRARMEDMDRAIRDAIALGELRELRQARGVTQERLAERLGVGQESVSRLERRDDVYLSTLRGYVEALGGALEMYVVFDDGDRVQLVTPEEVREPVAVPVGAVG